MMINQLPHEILIDIFSRLPAKSVGQSRCLSKPWRSLLSSPQFIKSHLNRNSHQETLIVISPSHSIHSMYPNNKTTSKSLQLGDNWVAFLGSFHGLVLLLNHDDEDEDVFLVNPTTLQQVKIPDSPLSLKRGQSFKMHGFGYDSCSDDYKIVMLCYCNTDNECADTFVDVYSVKLGIWRRVGTSPYDHAAPAPVLSSGAFVNGSVHWLATSRDPGCPSVIVAFDLAGEVFDEMPAPDGICLVNDVAVLGGCLCIVDARSSGGMDIWIMKEYGLADSWMKFSIDVACNRWDVIKPLCFAGGDVVLVTEGESMVVYNREKETLRDMVVDGLAAMFIDGGTYVQTLVSPTFR